MTGAIVDNGTLQLGQYAADANGTSTAVEVGNRITGTGGVTASSGLSFDDEDGIVLLTSANTCTGATLVEYGTLRGGVANAFGTNSAVTVTAIDYGTATLDLDGHDQAIGSLAGGSNSQCRYVSGSVINNGATAATLTVGGNNTSTEFDGSLSDGNGTLAPDKVGTGTLTIALSGGGSTLSGQGLAANTDGTYTLTGSASTVTSELQVLQFTPRARARRAPPTPRPSP